MVFLKLGGSLITNKGKPRTVRSEVLTRLAGEIGSALRTDPGLKLLLGHGSGSFGHIPARKYQTRRGVRTKREWRGFSEVWKEAAALNQHVMAALYDAGLPAIALPASAGLAADNRRVLTWDLTPIRAALTAGLLPVVYGDAIFDQSLGGTILSTEDLFEHLAGHFKPDFILLAGIEAGVWSDFPDRRHLVKKITPGNVDRYAAVLGGSAGTDVTGGMASKVQGMLNLVNRYPSLKVRIFSGVKPGTVQQALMGEETGTLISADS